MREKIKTICRSLEKEDGIRVLFAVENGSRAWRMDSKDSDFDVRFVFVRPVESYIQINKPVEVINVFYDKDGKPCRAENAFIDISGFDVFKFVRMLSSSNPTMIEWLVSDIVYYGEQDEVFRRFALKNFNQTALYHHYKSMCKSNYVKYLKSKALVTYKKYLYAYRGLVNAKWVVYKNSVPPIIFADTLKGMKDIIPDNVLEKLNHIIKLKSRGEEKDIISNIVKLDEYIEEFLKKDEGTPKKRVHVNLKELDEELRKIVLHH